MVHKEKSDTLNLARSLSETRHPESRLESRLPHSDVALPPTRVTDSTRHACLPVASTPPRNVRPTSRPEFRVSGFQGVWFPPPPADKQAEVSGFPQGAWFPQGVWFPCPFGRQAGRKSGCLVSLPVSGSRQRQRTKRRPKSAGQNEAWSTHSVVGLRGLRRVELEAFESEPVRAGGGRRKRLFALRHAGLVEHKRPDCGG